MRILENIAILVDADNAQAGIMDSIIEKVSLQGRIILKRIYGNWKNQQLKGWEEVIMKHAFYPVQQFDYVKGKNATDIALVIDAMELLHTGRYDAFVIVSSDSDYTPLTIKLKESGIFIIGVGKKETSSAFKQSCDDFIELETLDKQEASLKENQTKGKDGTSQKGTKKKVLGNEGEEIQEVHELFKKAYEEYVEDDGYANISASGAYIKRMKPELDSKRFGHAKWSGFIKAYSKIYEWKLIEDGGSSQNFMYKLKD